MKKILPYLFIILSVFVFFWQFFFKSLLPVPSDTIIGLYHPFRDLYAKDYPNGIPFKNFLITDPVRQQYPWRELVVSAEKKLELPLWNPYSFAGTPLLANFQSGSFYVFNILFFAMPFHVAWSLIIFLGPLMAGIFMLAYLNNLRLNKWGSLMGAISYTFCGFSIAWMEWGAITHVALWLPLILLSIDKMVAKTKDKKILGWSLIYLFSLTSAFFAGHLQTFFYLGVFSFAYLIARWFKYGKKVKVLALYIILNVLFLLLTSVQWIPTLQLISLSARNIDAVDFNSPGWFIPWQHLIQFIAPDFFGNPTTLNYWGVWNYGELVGYIGIMPLILALFAMLYRRDKKTLFFGTFFFLAIILSFPTFLAKIPYILRIPFLSTAQPTRLLFIVDFVLAVLSALGFDYLLKTKRVNIIYPLIFVLIILSGLWIFIPKEHLLIARSNLFLPTLLFIFSLILFLFLIFTQKKSNYTAIACIAIVIITVFDLLRFGWKFTPFTQKSYLFPVTKTITFLQKNLGESRVMTTDSRLFPPNFSAIYGLQSIDGYDPLYILRYGELMAASERGKADINPPFGFNRIITPHNYKSGIIDLLGVKYILSLSALDSPKLVKVFQEGQTITYENKNVLPRAFFARSIKLSKSKEESIGMLFDPSINLTQTGIVENGDEELNTVWSVGSAKIIQYSANKIIIDTRNKGAGFLILTDTFYPTWKASVDNKLVKIHIVDYNFRGVVVPSGTHRIEFYNSLF